MNKSYYVSLEDNDKINKEMESAFNKIEQLDPHLQEIYKSMQGMNPQEKLFFLDKVISDLIINSNMPGFYINGLINKLKEFVKEIDKEELKERKYSASYLG